MVPPAAWGATQPKNEEVKGGDIDRGNAGMRGLEGGRAAVGIYHESCYHTIYPISTVPLQQAHRTVVTKSHRAANDTNMYAYMCWDNIKWA